MDMLVLPSLMVVMVTRLVRVCIEGVCVSGGVTLVWLWSRHSKLHYLPEL